MIEVGTSRSDPRSSVRKLWLGGAAIVVAAVAVLGLVLLLIRDEGYGPLDAGPASGVGGPGVRSVERGGVDEFTLGRGGAYYFSLLENDGSHAVEVTRIPHDAAMADVRWAPAVEGDEVYFEPGRWRPLPATVPAAPSKFV